MDNEDNKISNITGEIAGEVEVFNIGNNEIERMTSDGEDGYVERPPVQKQKQVSDVEPPPVKKQKQNAKKSKIKVKWQKQHVQTQTFSGFD